MPGKGIFSGLFEVVPDAEQPAPPDAPPPAPAPPARAPSAATPRVASSLVPRSSDAAPIPTRSAARASAAPAGNSETVDKLVKSVLEQMPHDNAVFQLMTVMASIESEMPDLSLRRTMAMKMLASQGITADMITQGQGEIVKTIDGYFDGLVTQAQQARQDDVEGKREQARLLRVKIEDNKGRIAAIEAESSGFERDAAGFDEAADLQDQKLSQFTTDLETARAAARAAYGT